MIAVTGFGIVCAIGNNADEVLCSLQQGRSGVGPMRYLESKHSHLPVGEVKSAAYSMAPLLSGLS